MKIPPRYQVTPELVATIVEIDSLNRFFNHLNVPETLKLKLNRASLLKSSLFSAKIEGASKKQEINNIIKAYSGLENYFKKSKKIDQKLILSLHHQVMAKIDSSAGHYRKEMGGIFDQAGNVVYLPPPPTEISPLMGDLVSYINSNQEKFPLVTALVAHLIFEKIHPFIDGNGRVGRLLIGAVLKSKGYNLPLLVPFEEYLEKHRSDYYYYLDIGFKDCDVYLKFMLQAFLNQILKTRNQLMDELKQPSSHLMTPRREEIINIIKDHRQVSLDFLSRRFLTVTSRMIRYDLKKLVDEGKVVKVGRTRGAFYRIKSD